MNFGGGKPALKKQDREKISLAFEEKIDVNFLEGSQTRIAYLANVKSTTITDQTTGAELAAILMFFVEPDGSWFKAQFAFCPYFYVLCENSNIKEVIFYLQKVYASTVKSVEAVAKEDLTMINHLSGKTQTYIKLTFKNEADLMTVRKDLLPQIQKNKTERKTQEAYEGWYNAGEYADGSGKNTNYSQKITDIREYDLTYQIRVQIDNEIRVSHWYEVELEGPLMKRHTHLKDKIDKAAIRVLAFDIETTKQPLRFPDVKYDQIMMISYIIDGSGFLITNRQIVSEDISNFEYAPREDYDVGTFTVFNEPDELRLLKKFFSHIRETKPTVFTTFNGDFFDWPFIQARADHHKIKMEEEIGIFNNDQGEFFGRFASHLDCLYWVKRDAFLPQGSHGLKMVTKAKLGYDPVELDPELMVKYAKERPQNLAEYSVSDAVATYFLYMIQIHDFIFALCTIIPTNPDDVLRRGSGTLCENLLMAEAFRGNIIFPNKQVEDHEKFYKGKLIDSETYIGGHVECLQTGVYRSDFPVEFKLDKAGYQSLIDKIPQIMDFALTIEPGHQNKDEITNYEEVRQEIESKLVAIRDKCPKLVTTPLIYHVDVGAMYPNIILTNRLQPTSIVNEQICAGCLYNKEENNCKRKLDWQWRGEVFTLNKGEYERIKYQVEEQENDENNRFGKNRVQTSTINQTQTFADKLKKRVKEYCSAAHKRVHETKTETKTDTVCMRENPFYVDTVRDFRDRRYDFKRMVKTWGDKMRAAQKAGDIAETENAKNRVTLYESLQLAHKIILNSFYGYVMRRGARWYSMEMAAMVTHTGGNIIMDSRSLYDQIGMPLELDTDGIWTLLPQGFPETFTFKFVSGKTFRFDFPCTMSNELIYKKYGNPQYQTLVNQKQGLFDVRNEMSIFFEIDGPYKCMLIPASTEENRMLKKRYAVFNHAGKMTEVKGFELKRRGELQIIKIFQQEVFTKFLEGSNLQECYDACGEVAQKWYDILDSKGAYVNDAELIEYIGEQRVIGKSSEEYGSQKSAAITCAKRLNDCLGSETTGVEKGLNVKFIISKLPQNASVTERAIPTQIFDMEDQIMKKYLKKWTGDGGMTNFNIRNIIDWDYYKDRLAGTIQKIVMIPAALQNCLNPVESIEFPDWLHRKIKIRNDKVKQKKLDTFFKVADIEDMAQKKLKFEAQTAAINKKKLESAALIQKQPELLLENCPQPDQDFGTWLKYQKSNWRSIRKQLKADQGLKRKQNNIPGLLKGSQALMQFIRNNDETILNSTWNLLQIEPTFEPGILKIWAVTTEGFMFNVRLQVGRTVYINSKIVNTDPEFKKVENVLPRNIKRHHLYQWESSEEHFLQKFNTLKYTSLLSDKIEGIYETRVPPKFRALVELGFQIKPIKSKIPRQEQAYGRTYKIPEFQVINNETYLESDSFERIYLLHSCTDKRHLWGMFIGATREIYFFIVNPALKAIQTQGQISLESAFQKSLQEYGLEVDFAAWQVKDQQNFINLSQACKGIEQKFVEHKQKNKNATLIVLQSTISQAQLPQLSLNSLLNDFPVIRCPTFDDDNEYPALDWLKFAARNMTYRFSEVEEWLIERIKFSRNTAIPLCNLENSQFVIDTLFARQLFRQKHLLWYSDSTKPDLGGHEDRNYRYYIQQDIENPVTNNQGFYRNYSIEINIQQLALNTILKSDHLPEFSDIINPMKQPDIDSKKKRDKAIDKENKPIYQEFDMDMDEFATCGPAFLRLKQLVQLWLNDKTRDQSYADPLLMQLYSWLTNPNSKLYDPLLHRMIHIMMSKVFFWLLAKFKELRCHVIHGDFQKIIVTTEKRSFEEASTHIDFVLSQIKKEEKFSHLDLVPGEFWQILLYKDPFNYAGIPESNPDKMSVKFNISDYLPEAIRNKFKFTVLRFVTEVHKENKKMDLKDDNQFEQTPSKQKKDEIVDYMEAVDDVSKERDHDFICKLINEYFSQKVLQNLTEIMDERKKALQDTIALESESEADEEDDEGSKQMEQHDYREQRRMREQERIQKELKRWEFPDRIGSCNSYSVPALEFSKMLCNHVFGLDPAFKYQAQVLFKNCLTTLRFKEFSQEVQSGKEPSLTLVIPDVICANCQTVIDMDICRTHQIYLDPVNETAAPVWRCSSCEMALNKDQIERRLLDILNKRMINYQLQDLKCKNCKMVSNSIVKRYCECTGKLIQTSGYELPEKLLNQNLLNQMTDIRLLIRLMRNFGERHEMKMLQAAADNLLEMMPAFS